MPSCAGESCELVARAAAGAGVLVIGATRSITIATIAAAIIAAAPSASSLISRDMRLSVAAAGGAAVVADAFFLHVVVVEVAVLARPPRLVIGPLAAVADRGVAAGRRVAARRFLGD